MSSLVVSGDTSGSVTIAAPAVAGTPTLTLPTTSGTILTSASTINAITSGTAQASTSGTSIDFTGIPSGVKRVTVMFSGVSTNGTSVHQIQLGAGSVTTSGYAVSSGLYGGSYGGQTATSGFIFSSWNNTGNLFTGVFTFCLLGSNTWIGTGIFVPEGQAYQSTTSGKIVLGGTLDRVRYTTVNGTDTFDAGSINILYES